MRHRRGSSSSVVHSTSTQRTAHGDIRPPTPPRPLPAEHQTGPPGHSSGADSERAPFAGYLAARAQELGSDLPLTFTRERSAVQSDLVSCQLRSKQLAARKATTPQQQKRAADVAQHALNVKVRETEARLAAREAALLQRQADRQNVEEVRWDFQQAFSCERDTTTEHGAARTEAIHTLRPLGAPSSTSNDAAMLSSEAWDTPLINWAVAAQYTASDSLPVVGRQSSFLPGQTWSTVRPTSAAIQPHRAFTIEDVQVLERGLELHWSRRGAEELDCIKEQLGLPINFRNRN